MKLDRNALIEKLAEHMADNADLETLQEYYYSGTIDYLDDLTDEDLLSECDWQDFDTKEFEIEGEK